MSDKEIGLMAHLMRRAGFGATRKELEELVSKGYDAVVEDLLQPERFPDLEEDALRRYYLHLNHPEHPRIWKARWIWRMINTKRPLEEKMTLFWHQIFAASDTKSGNAVQYQVDQFRRNGLSDMRTCLLDLSRSPAMIHFLDNNENHNGEPNENYGRELLELFSMGVGNYTEDDIKMCARAFTGWTITQPIPTYPQGAFRASFDYRKEDHDDSVKTFLGETGRFNGEDIIDIIVKQPATARFICRHMYNFFVADEPQVPSWHEEPPQDPEAIDILAKAYIDSGGQIRPVLGTLFRSDFFKEARFKRVKSPAELVAGTIKLVGTFNFPDYGLLDLSIATILMGQELLNPPTVEGWHTGKEWIDGGILGERVNFAVDQMADVSKPGIQDMIARLATNGSSLTPQEVVERCLDLVGPMEVGTETRRALLGYAETGGEMRFDTEAERKKASARVGRLLQLIVASREYQFA